MIRNKPRGATVYGIDLGKNIFHVVGTDSAGNVVQRVKFRRDTLRAFFERAERAVVGMEACPGSQWLARKLQAMGHTVRIIPAQFVKPYVKSHKNDTIVLWPPTGLFLVSSSVYGPSRRGPPVPRSLA